MDNVTKHLNQLTFSGASPRTIAARAAILTNLSKRGPLLALDEDDLMDWLSRPHLAPESRRAYRSHIRSFYAWALDRGLIDHSPAQRIPPVKVPTRAPRPIAATDLHLALTHADPRMRAWLLLGALAGMRCMEIAGLRPDDVFAPDDGGMTLLHMRVTKGGGSGVVPAHPDILEALAVLPVYAGLWWDVQPKYVSQQIGTYLHSLGVQASAHRLRSFAGTAWLRASDHDLLTTATLLRHASVATTMAYAQLDPARPGEVVNLVRLAG